MHIPRLLVVILQDRFIYFVAGLITGIWGLWVFYARMAAQ